MCRLTQSHLTMRTYTDVTTRSFSAGLSRETGMILVAFLGRDFASRGASLYRPKTVFVPCLIACSQSETVQYPIGNSLAVADMGSMFRQIEILLADGGLEVNIALPKRRQLQPRGRIPSQTEQFETHPMGR
jgi:hypothetical protein